MANDGVSQRKISLLILWFGIMGGPISWAIHLLVSYELVPVVCLTGWTFLLHLTTLVCGAIAGLAGYLAYRNWRKTGQTMYADIGVQGGRTGFMAVSGMFISAVFLFVILVEGTGVFYLDPCTHRNVEETGMSQLQPDTSPVTGIPDNILVVGLASNRGSEGSCGCNSGANK